MALDEVALLVEDAVVRQHLLAVAAEQTAVVVHGTGIERTALGILGIAHEDGNPAALAPDGLERARDGLAQAVVQQEILGRIAADGQFREDD